MKRHFTVSVVVIESSKTLLVRHKKLGKWLQPGGHLEENEIPTEAAIREVLEETGITVELIPQENLSIDVPHARSILRPYLCLLEEIPAQPTEPAHQHLDLIYIGKPTSSERQVPQEECGWFTLAEIEVLHREGKLFPEVFTIAKSLL